MTKDERIIFFDFDGVIVDTFEMCYAISNLVNPDLSKDEYISHFEGNINDAAGKKKNMDTQSSKDHPTGIDFFTEYARRMGEHRPEEQIPELIRDLSENYLLSIISSTRSDLIQQFLELHNLTDCFSEILGNEVHTSKVIKFQMALEAHKLLPHQSLMITDTLGDIREARKAGLDSIGVTWGFQPIETLLRGEPFAVVKNPVELEMKIAEYFGKNIE